MSNRPDVVLALREARSRRGLTQKDAARVSGVGEKTISFFETGARVSSMKVSQLEKLLQLYGLTLDQFFVWSVGDDHDQFVSVPVATPQRVRNLRDQYCRDGHLTRSEMREIFYVSHLEAAAAPTDLQSQLERDGWIRALTAARWIRR